MTWICLKELFPYNLHRYNVIHIRDESSWPSSLAHSWDNTSDRSARTSTNGFCDEQSAFDAPPFITRKISREKAWTGLLPQGGNRTTTSCVVICDAALLHARLGNAYQENNTDQRLREGVFYACTSRL